MLDYVYVVGNLVTIGTYASNEDRILGLRTTAERLGDCADLDRISNWGTGSMTFDVRRTIWVQATQTMGGGNDVGLPLKTWVGYTIFRMAPVPGSAVRVYSDVFFMMLTNWWRRIE
jgi:hypothetical protein